MRKLLAFILLSFLMLGTLSVQAIDMKSGEELDISEVVNDDLYIAGGRIDINAPVNGDLTIAGGELNINGDVLEDANIAGGDIVVSGNIGDDLRIVGGSVRINSNVEGDLIIGAGDVRIGKGVIITGDLLVGAGRVVLDGEVKGNAKVAAGEFVLNGTIEGDTELMIDDFKNPGKTGIINGNLLYKSHEENTDIKSSVKGVVTFEKSFVKEEMKEGIIGFITSYLLIKIVGLFLFASLILLYFEKMFSSVSKNLVTKTGKSFLYGFLTIIGIPFAIVLLLISVIGIPFGLFLLFAYIFIFVFLGLLNTMVISSLIINKYKISKMYQKLLVILGFTLLFGIINGINILVGFFTLGSIALKKLDIVESLRK